MIYITMFFEFFKIGLFSIGGGLATLPFLYELADKYDWFTPAMISDMLAVSESTPGPIGINMATYTGFHMGGVLGGIVTTIGLVTPSVIVIYIVYGFLKKFKNSIIVEKVFNGIRPCVTGLIAAVWFGLLKHEILGKGGASAADFINIKAVILFIALFALTKKTDKHPLFYIAIAAGIGIVFSF